MNEWLAKHRQLWLSMLFVAVIALFALGSAKADPIERQGWFTAGSGLAIWWAMLTGVAFPATLQGIVLVANALAWLPLPASSKTVATIVATALGVIWLQGQIKLDPLGWFTILSVCALGCGFATGFPVVLLTANALLVIQSLWFWSVLKKPDQVAIGYLFLNVIMGWNIAPAAIHQLIGR